MTKEGLEKGLEERQYNCGFVIKTPAGGLSIRNQSAIRNPQSEILESLSGNDSA